MGGWISLIGDFTDIDSRVSKFKKVFSVANVPNLRLEIHHHGIGGRTIGWSWNPHSIPDIYIKKTRNGDVIILCGAITSIGRFGILPSCQDLVVEKILELWIEHNDNIIDQLNGSFSCLFHSPKKEETTIFTDRFASRSVWICREKNQWIIGNFPSAIATVLKNSPKLDPVGLWSLFHTGRHLGTHGLYNNIRGMLAGQKAVLSNNNAQISRWWERRYFPEYKIKPLEWGYTFAKSLAKSANRYKKASQNSYLFLSGGLDSRITAASFKKPLKTITLCTSPNAESKIASLVSSSLNLEHETIIRSPYWYLDTLNAAALICSGNFFTHHTHFIVPIQRSDFQKTRAEFLLGDLLENINKHYFSKPNNREFIFNPDHIENILYSLVPYVLKDLNRIGIHFNETLKESIKKRYLEALKSYSLSIMDVSYDNSDRFDTFLRWADVSAIPTYSMIACIWPFAKDRNIFFDNDINKLSLKIPSTLRGSGTLHKWILYHLKKELLFLPDANNMLPPFFPNLFKSLAKQMRPTIGRMQRSFHQKGIKKKGPVLKTSGSWLLLHEMYRKDPKYRDQIIKIIFDKSIFSSDIFDLNQIKKTWESFISGNIGLLFEIEALISFGNLIKSVPHNSLDL